MFIIASAMQKDFHNHATLEMLKNIPDMTWTPSIPHRFAGMSEESLRGMLLPKGKQAYFEKTTLVGAAPAAFNWQDAAPECMVVRDQGQCGSCWAFSSVGPFSDNRCFSKKDATRVIYSEQYMVSCDSNNLGCNGGYLTMDQYFLKKTGVPTDKCVSYKSGSKGVTGKCPTTCDDKSPIVLVKSTKFEDVCTNEESIKVGLTQGALQTAFTVYSDFMYYNGGIYQHKSGSVEGGHAVTFVGYGEESGVKYWVVRNSWGASWGEKGYFRMIRGINDCGIEDQCFLTSV
ncbi:Cathepsin_B [Hexamita inflata]|uniref:Cathepsin B n=1 Tax=Hexamita inflata TaxID=28002 RepID=A0AA86PV81_9EUKA|nr:Cathepsin B [Hexamita inflata]CAI9941717.1 Cathepsin B [Hexamita inflata]CAI9941720.1 Cathepsin B [Hexamita inflata]CAI9941725.1 Cathepsin B [Hexamita inflata]CAI9944784.1 Cathepsin B [Hexamita inflata]